MEAAGGSAAGAGGGSVLGAAAQEPRGEEEKGAGAAAETRRTAGGGMKFRVSARAPHGVGALLLIGGAAVVGAAVLAWRASRHGGKKRAAAGDQRDRQPAKDEVVDGGVVEDGKVQGDTALVQKFDKPTEDLSVGNTEIGSGTLDGKAAEESHQVHKDRELTADQMNSKPEERIGHDSGRNVKVNTHGMDKEQAEKIDQNSSTDHVEITTHDMCQHNEHVEQIDHVERIDQNSSRKPVEIVMQEMVTVCLISGNMEKVDEDLNKNNIEKEMAQKDNKDKDVEGSDQSRLSINSPGIILNKQDDQSDGIQEAESMENTPTAQLMMHQEQLLDDMVTDSVTETEEEEKQGEGRITDESELEQDEKKALAGLVELVSSPALSSLVKQIEKKEPELPRRNETGMKTEQDYTNGEVIRQHDLVSKGGATQGGEGGAIATMDRRSPALAILAIIFAMTIGITIIVRLYAPSRATKFQMNL